MQIINPATEEIIKEMQEDSIATLKSKFEDLRSTQFSWQNLSLADRITILKRFSSLLKENIEELAAVLTSEVGKPLQQSRNEINGARTRIEWLTNNALRYLSEEWMTK